MEDYQKRVVAEKEDLDTKIKALQNFIENKKGLISRATEFEVQDMTQQLHTMFRYSQILSSRINRF